VYRFAVDITAGVSIVGSIPWEEARHKSTHRRQFLYLAAGAGGEGWRQKRAEEKMIVEGAWILVIAVVTFAAVVTIVLLGSGKLYDPDRSHE
jgi:hypothetical protein